MWKEPKTEETKSIRPVTEKEMNEIVAQWKMGSCIGIGFMCDSVSGEGLSLNVGVCVWFWASLLE